MNWLTITRYSALIWLFTALSSATASNVVQNDAPVEIKYVSQRIWMMDTGPTESRIIRFSFLNRTSRRILIQGHGDEEGFHPVGYTMRYDQNKKTWRYPTSDNSPIGWDDIRSQVYHTRVLEPQKRVTLETTVRFHKRQERLKKVLFFSYEDDEEPSEILSPVFILKK